MRVAVVGAAGYLGGAIVREFGARHDVAALDRAALDLTDASNVDAVIARIRPDLVVNCAAYNAVDRAEDQPVDALAVNAFGVRALARAACRGGARLVHYSTDFVFDGLAAAPYTEDDPPNPRGVYAVSKLLGEWFAADVERSYVLRVESLFGRVPGGSRPRGSLQAILDALRAGQTARVFVDRTVSPSHIGDVARATRELVEQDAAPGIYHCVNSGSATWEEVAEQAAAMLGVVPRLERVRLADVELRASRPRYCALSNAKLAGCGIAMPAWQDALRRHLESGH